MNIYVYIRILKEEHKVKKKNKVTKDNPVKMGDLIHTLSRLCAQLDEASKGWCVTHETPKKTRDWVDKLHSTAHSSAYKLGELINNSLSEYELVRR
jgi:ribonuclease HI